MAGTVSGGGMRHAHPCGVPDGNGALIDKMKVRDGKRTRMKGGEN
jgi:hypothetical protein